MKIDYKKMSYINVNDLTVDNVVYKHWIFPLKR